MSCKPRLRRLTGFEGDAGAGGGACCCCACCCAAFSLFPEDFRPLHVILCKVEPAGVAQRPPVVLVFAPEGRVARATVLADLQDSSTIVCRGLCLSAAM
jgi:hypothetical protein